MCFSRFRDSGKKSIKFHKEKKIEQKKQILKTRKFLKKKKPFWWLPKKDFRKIEKKKVRLKSRLKTFKRVFEILLIFFFF